MADFYRAEKVNDRITAIISFTGEIMYLVNGSERSLLIDTCVGAGNLRDFVEKQRSRKIKMDQHLRKIATAILVRKKMGKQRKTGKIISLRFQKKCKI